MIGHRCPSARAALLLGEAPNEATAGRPELWLAPGSSSSADHLLEASGLDLARYGALFDRGNLLLAAQPRIGRGRSFDARAATAAATALVLQLQGERARCVEVVCLGRRVAKVMPWAEDYEPAEYFEPALLQAPGHLPGPFACVVPHPSGVNKWWNDEENRERAREFFERLAREVTLR